MPRSTTESAPVPDTSVTPNTDVLVTCRSINPDALSRVAEKYTGLYETATTTLDTLANICRISTAADYEDSVEDLIRVIIAVDTVGKNHTWIETGNDTATCLNSRRRLDSATLVTDYDTVRLGGVPLWGTGVIDPHETNGDYHLSKVFRHRAGRDTALLTVDTQSELDPAALLTTVRSFTDVDHTSDVKIMLKIAGDRKYPLLCVTVHTDDTVTVPVDAHDPYGTTLTSWSFDASVHRAVTVLVQTELDLVNEYRCFTRSGRVVTSAGNIESDTPLNAYTGTSYLFPFSDRVETERNNSDVVRDTDRTAELREFADTVATEFRAEGLLDDYLCLDVAWDRTRDRPVVVEVNPVTSAGFYATAPAETGYLADFLRHRLAVGRDTRLITQSRALRLNGDPGVPILRLP